MALHEGPERSLVAFGDTAQKVSVARLQAAHTITVATQDLNGSRRVRLLGARSLQGPFPPTIHLSMMRPIGAGRHPQARTNDPFAHDDATGR